MDFRDIKETPVWQLYQIGLNYHHRNNILTDTDRNFRFYNGDQWNGAKLGGVEPVVKNFIKPIVKYKLAVIHANLYAIVFSSQNYDSPEIQAQANQVCKMMDRMAAQVWEADKLDAQLRRLTKRAAINSEGIMYVDFNTKAQRPRNEIIKKCDIFYANENDDDIQAQPYILMRRRLPVLHAREMAKGMGVEEELLQLIVGDNETFDLSGDAAKDEVDNMVTLVYKLYKEGDEVKFDLATRWLDIAKGKGMGIPIYPIAHMLWEEKEGSARGEGEVRNLIPNQIEVNRTEMRRVLTVKQQAYPMKVVDVSKVSNPEAMNTVGGVIRTNGQTVDDVHKVVGTIHPAQMSADVKLLQDDLINMSRELAGAGDVATGTVNPEAASGRAILAVQQASQAPMTEQRESFKAFLEDLAQIWLEYMIAHAGAGITLQRVEKNDSGEDYIVQETVDKEFLETMKATVRIDITPKSVFDRFAQEQTIENLLVRGLFHADRISELEAYVNSLDDDATAPKQKLLGIVKDIKNRQRQIAQTQAEAQRMAQEFSQFIGAGPQGQAQQLAAAQMAAQQQNAAAQMAVQPQQNVMPQG